MKLKCKFIFIYIIVLAACSKGTKENKIENMFFDFDSTLVAKTVAVNNLSFKIPAGMTEISNQLSAEKITDKIPFNFDVNDMRCFLDSSSTALLLVSSSNNEIALIQNDILSNTPVNLISDDTFYKDNTLICQYLYSDDNNVMLILLIPDTDIVTELIYLIPKTNYHKYARKIESSLGSIIQGG